MARLRRAFRRQFPLFLLVVLAVAGGGIAYDYSGGVRPLASTWFWLPLGLAAGLALALMREIGRNTVTSVSSLGRHRDFTVLGAAPELTPRMLRQLPPDRRTPLGCLALQPASPFATAFRDLQSAVSDQSLVSFIAPLPDEGATTAALCTAVSAAQQGRSVIMVDCDLRRRSLTRALGLDPDYGVLEVSEEPEAWQACVSEEEETGVHIMPAARLRNPWRSLVGAQGFPMLVANLRRHYDLVVLDCPPALGSADGPLLAGGAERCIVVTAWDRTPLNAVRNAVRLLRRRAGVKTGVYVNRVPPQYRFGRLRPD